MFQLTDVFLVFEFDVSKCELKSDVINARKYFTGRAKGGTTALMPFVMELHIDRLPSPPKGKCLC